MKICVSGTHSSRKSTLSYQLAAYYKEKGLNVRLIQEIARKCPLGINDDFSHESMLWIYHTQVAEELASRKDHQIVVCDRSAIDPFMYGMAKNFDGKDSHLLLTFARLWMQTYDKIFFVMPDVPAIKDGVRDTNEEFRLKVHEQFDYFFNRLESMDEEFMYKLRRVKASDISALNFDLERYL